MGFNSGFKGLNRCSRYLSGWLIGHPPINALAFCTVWREQTNHFTDCYFCLTKIDGHNSQSKHTIFYPNIPSALRPVEHYDSLPFPNPPQQRTLREEEPLCTFPDDEHGPSFPNVNPDFPELILSHLISQSELNDLVTDFNFSKIQAELLLLVQRDRICYSKVLKYHKGKASSHCLHFVSNDGELVIVML